MYVKKVAVSIVVLAMSIMGGRIVLWVRLI